MLVGELAVPVIVQAALIAEVSVSINSTAALHTGAVQITILCILHPLNEANKYVCIYIYIFICFYLFISFVHPPWHLVAACRRLRVCACATPGRAAPG